MNITTIERPGAPEVLHAPTPEVVITLPFQATMKPKEQLEVLLKQLAAQAERKLLQAYRSTYVLPVIDQLRSLIKDVNYSSHKANLLLLASADTAKALYLDLPLLPGVRVDEDFCLRDLVAPTDARVPYLVLLLSGQLSKMFHSDGVQLTLIKNNVFKPAYANAYVMEKEVGQAPEKDHLLDKFLHQMDAGLSQVLEAWPLPVFVIGNEKVTGHFAGITRNGRQIAAYIHKNCVHSALPELEEVLEPYLSNWRFIREQMALRHLELALECGKLTSGLENVKKTANGRNARLLIIEKGFTGHILHPGDAAPFYLHTEVDPIIERVLLAGGKVEWVEEGQLGHHGHIALVRYY